MRPRPFWDISFPARIGIVMERLEFMLLWVRGVMYREFFCGRGEKYGGERF